MTTNSWAGGASGAFGTEGSSDSDWGLGHVPKSTEDAVINTGGSGDVVVTSNEDVGSIALAKGDDLYIETGPFFAAQNGTGPNVNKGAIVVFQADFIVGNGSSAATFDNGSTGLVQLDGTSASQPANLLISGSVNLTGSGTIEMTIGDPIADNLISGNIFSSATPDLTNQSEDISGTGTIGGDLDFTNNATVETNNTTSANAGVLDIEGSAAAGGFTNNNLVQADNGGTLIFGVDGQSSTLVNTGEIALVGNSKTTSLKIAGNVTISGPGSGGLLNLNLIDFTGSQAGFNDEILSDGKTATLTLVNQVLKGAGSVGDSHLSLNNQSGFIDANDAAQSLILSTGSNTITNGASAVLQADGGDLFIESPVDNSGTIEAIDGGVVFVYAPISGSGAVDVGGQNSALWLNTTVSGNVTFTGTAAQVIVNNTNANGGIGGNIIGAQVGDSIDFLLVHYSSAVQAVWSQISSSGGTLSLVSGGMTLDSVNLAGQYVSSEFAAESDGSGGTTVFTPNPRPPAGTSADMIMRDGSDGDYEIYDIGSNAIGGAFALGQVGPEWQVAGLGGFDGADTSDMILRATSGADAGDFQVFDISNNNITDAVGMGTVGLSWAVSGFGDFSTNPGETDMLMRDSTSGAFEVYDISGNSITFAGPMGSVGLEWTVAGFGDFSGNANETDMLMRNSTTGAFEVYDIGGNSIAFAGPMGSVGLEWTVAGFGDFSGNANETDMLMRNSTTGAFEVYDISGNNVTFAGPMGQVGLEWQVAGFGPLDGAGSTAMLMRNTGTGAFEVYDISANAIAAATAMGQVGTEWLVAGIATDPPGAAPANAQLVQAMASMGTTAAVSAGNTAQIGEETSALTPLTASPRG